MKHLLNNRAGVWNLEYHDETNHQGVNTEGFDQGQTNDHGGHDLSARFGVSGRPLECSTDGITHCMPGSESGNSYAKAAGNGHSKEKYPHSL